jgi:D-glycero-D-manno-heptose 1,7-bisphosphate phosphatase
VTGRTAVFLDRDGVLNKSVTGPDGVPHPPSDLSDFVLVENAVEACRELRSLGLLLVVVTNQPDVARGTQQREVVEAMNRRLSDIVELDDIRVCYHDDADACDCRKPKPGLILGAARERGIDLASSYMIGDRWRDVEAGTNAGCTTILIDSHPGQSLTVEPTIRVDSLLAAAHWIRESLGGIPEMGVASRRGVSGSRA